MRFEFEKELGTGGTGTVYKAYDLVGRTTVAVKKLRDDTVSPHREVRLAREVAHPNVCRVFDLHNEDGQLLISMEYLDGETLRTWLRRSNPQPLDRCLDIARQMLDGVEALHEKDIVHRDRKSTRL